MTKDIYDEIPILGNSRYTLRAVNKQADADDLLNVYSDEKAVPLFNSDNCNGEDFYYVTMEQMKQAIDFWEFSYQNKYFVRWVIVDKKVEKVIGTMELFNRRSEDYFDNCGLLRLDLRSDYEVQDCIESILGIIVPRAKEMFGCDKIATKAIPVAKERIVALEHMDFCLLDESLVGHDGTRYGSYYVMKL